MRAVVYEKYGSPEVLKLKNIQKPSPKKNEVLVKIISSSVSAADWRLRKADPFLARIFNGLLKPKRVNVLGFEIAGIIEQIGENVSSFKIGEPVFAYCGFKFGGYAEYTCLKETDVIFRKPENMSFEEASTTPLGALTALSFLKKAQISSGHKILIYGASGSVGTFAIQLAKYFGAEVTAVCSERNLPLVNSLGADFAIDYTKTNVSKLNQQYDIIFDAVGKIQKRSIKQNLGPNGKFVSVKSTNQPEKNDLIFLKQVIELNKLKSVIDRTYKLTEIRAAHSYVEQFRKKGNVALLID
jgi:NADPH:quinone reductase-like Zn-dependent oxidoreductase